MYYVPGRVLLSLHMFSATPQNSEVLVVFVNFKKGGAGEERS